jgi:hypothetical protein
MAKSKLSAYRAKLTMAGEKLKGGWVLVRMEAG